MGKMELLLQAAIDAPCSPTLFHRGLWWSAVPSAELTTEQLREETRCSEKSIIQTNNTAHIKLCILSESLGQRTEQFLTDSI